MLLVTADCREGYASVAAQVEYKCTPPAGTAEFGDGRGAFMALQAKYRLDRESRMQGLQDQLATLQVTEAERYDPARVIQELRRVCVELGALSVTQQQLFQHGKLTHFSRALPDNKY